MNIVLRLLAAVLLCLPGLVSAAYPERPITMIVAFAPGGGTDVVARALVPYLEKHIGGGAKIVIVNRPGAGGDIGFAATAAAAPDGYTMASSIRPAFSPSRWSARRNTLGRVSNCWATWSTTRRASPCMPTRRSRI